MLNNKFNNRKPDIWLKLIILLLKLMNEIMKIMIHMMKKKKKRENMFKNHNFKFF